MTPPALFVGLVSHEGSRFTSNQGPAGLARQLAEQVPGSVVQVNTQNLLPPDSTLVSPEAVQASLDAELRLEAAWFRFLGRPLDTHWYRQRGLRHARRLTRKLAAPSPQMVRRLLNIELSHLDLMRNGLDAHASWVLILEDDGMTSDVPDVARGLAGVMAESRPPGFVNLSRSFGTSTLGIAHLLSPSGAHWHGARAREVLTSALPVTNTVCAIAYERSFLQRLVQAWDELPMEPVVPVDWKLNLALMRMTERGDAGSGTSWLVEPGPIVQMSMQPAGILPS